MSIDPKCVACNAHEESIEHIFRECPIATHFWRRLGIPQSKKATFRAPFSEWIRANCLGYEKHSLNIPWKFIFPQAMWLLWKQRNTGVFKKEGPNKRLNELWVAEHYALSKSQKESTRGKFSWGGIQPRGLLQVKHKWLGF